ncbi:hypothetical protein PC123_g11742 [Phytophthora cactorum]|nr:hypothetical protein PC123_g11742 [Phytophthora cactorum]
MKKGDTFDNKEAFKLAIVEASVADNCEVVFPQNNKHRVKAIYKSQPCQYFVNAHINSADHLGPECASPLARLAVHVCTNGGYQRSVGGRSSKDVDGGSSETLRVAQFRNVPAHVEGGKRCNFPCIHACAAILFRRKDLLNYVSAYYSVVKLQAAFEGITLPVDFNTITNDDRSMASAWTPQSFSVA